jgi:hypothetical protein
MHIDHEQDERCDGSTARLFEKPDFLHNREKVLEKAVVEINDLRTPVLNQPIKKYHLIANIAYIGDPRNLWQIIRQLGTFVAQVERRHASITEDIKLGEQSGH